MNKVTVVLGASPNYERYSYKATILLKEYGHTVYPLGIKAGKIENQEIIISRPNISDVDTVTLYLSAQNQVSWYDYILSLNPKRIIFNPGAENQELIELAKDKGIECLNACTLVLLKTGMY
jgi:predicted CoA-binding protein